MSPETRFTMQSKHKLVYVVLTCMLLLGGVVLFINVRAQVPKQAQIAFQSDRHGKDEIYVMDADGKNPRRLTNNPANDQDPVWSPDGQRIAFLSYRDRNLEIYVMDADGKNPRNLTNNPAEDWDPAWSPDGLGIAFVSKRDGNYEIYVMDANGGNLSRLTNDPAWDLGPDWFDPAFAYKEAVFPAGKLRGTWGWVKQSSK